MKTAIDTNVISALWSETPLEAAAWRALRVARGDGALAISAPVYAELMAYPKGAPDVFIEEFAAEAGIEIDFTFGEEVWREAGRRFARYAERRRASRGGMPKHFLADFLIGAHALIEADRLLTFDTQRYRKDFPELELVVPRASE